MASNPSPDSEPGGNITLIGMPGAGKSTIGRELATYLGYGFIDTDVMITEHHGGPLQEVARERGNAGLREAEDEAVLSLRVHRSVLAPGGSIVFGEAAMAHLHRISRVVFIRVPLEELSERVGTDLTARGIVHEPGQTLGDVMAVRAELYERHADQIYESPHTPPHRAAREIAALLGLPAAPGQRP